MDKNSYFDKIFSFKGSDILLPIIAIFILVFYTFLFGRGIDAEVTTTIFPYWCVLAIVSIFIASVCIYQKGIVTKRFVGVVSCIVSLSFFMLVSKIYHAFPWTLNVLNILEIIISLYCIYKILEKPLNLKTKGIWLLPIIYIIIDSIFHSILLIVPTAIFLLLFTSIAECGINKKSYKISVPVLTIILYTFSALVYFPYNPFLSSKYHIKAINISQYPKSSSLIIEKDGGYYFVDGFSFNGEKIIDTKFNSYTDIMPYIQSFGELSIPRTNIPQPYFVETPSECLYPILIKNRYAYIACDKALYDKLKSDISSSNIVNKQTAKIYYDYLELLSKCDSTSIDNIIHDYAVLQDSLISLSTNIDNNKVSQTGCEQILREISSHLTIGMLNALSYDLILNKDYMSALKMFSFQFFMTHYNSYIYKKISTNINFNLDNTYGTYKINDVDLRKINTFEPWTKMFSMSVGLAGTMLTDQSTRTLGEIKEILQKRVKNISENIRNVAFDSDSTMQLKNELTHIRNRLSKYEDTPNLVKFITSIQQFFYKCIENNLYPDYNSYFLNRFNEVSPMIPFSDLSKSAYEKIRLQYDTKFNQDIRNIKELNDAINEYQSMIDDLLSVQLRNKQALNQILEILEKKHVNH